ncbi:serine hydrolase, partial [Staphylococcus epidermidis]|uniref:serine hydrolase n=1 Tax=Staphylococcus epidermidis TaxID=1282 RepID=UPI00119D3979
IQKKPNLNPHTQFQIPSNTKPFTPYPILQLAQQPKINLNHKLTTFIPPFKINYQHKQRHITIQHLLPQTSHIP